MRPNLLYQVFYNCLNKMQKNIGIKFINSPIIDKVENVFDFLLMNNHNSVNEKETFFLDKEKKYLLRTHTTSFQNNALKNMKDNNNINGYITGGVVFRKDDSSRHSFYFHQIDGIFYSNDIFKSIHLIMEIIQEEISYPIKYEIRESYFPFTYPSYEIFIHNQETKEIIEIMGCGNIHNSIINNLNLELNNRSIFAFGIGIDRISMIKYKYNNIKNLFKSYACL